MQKFFCGLLLSTTCLVLAGCEPNIIIEPEYHPHLMQNGADGIHQSSVQIVVQDDRKTFPRLLAVMDKPGYFGYQGIPFDLRRNYQLTEPVAEYVQTSLHKAFVTAGYSMRPPSELASVRTVDTIVNVHILGTGISNTRTVEGNDIVAHVFIRTQVNVMDGATQSVLNTSLITVDGEATQKIDEPDNVLLSRALADAVNRLANQLINNPRLRMV